jgi:hypothetical protein
VLIDTLGSECGLGHGLVFADAQLLPMSPCFEVVQWADDNEDGDGRATRLADEVDFALEAATKWHICEPWLRFERTGIRSRLHSGLQALS